MTRKYMLNGHVPYQEKDLMTWGRWYETSATERTVAFTPKSPHGGNISGDVSTVFTSLEPVGSSSEPPLLFQTVVFGGPWNFWGQNVATWEEAEALHAKVVEALKAGKPEGQFV
jgi:hypothetical protein